MKMNSHHIQWKKDEAASFEGWDFSYIKERMIWDREPWNYQEIAKDLVRQASAVLDIATGGGEKLSELAPFPSKAVAIEGWHQNVSVAKKRLGPLRVDVLEVNDTGPYPFKNEEFDLVLNRHGGLAIEEIARVLKKGGQFLTQQVDGLNTKDLIEVFGEKPKWPNNNLTEVSKKVTANNLEIKKAEEWTGKVKFTDVGAIVYYIVNTPWAVEKFSVDTHKKYLEILQERLDKGEKLEFIAKRFLLWCQKK